MGKKLLRLYISGKMPIAMRRWKGQSFCAWIIIFLLFSLYFWAKYTQCNVMLLLLPLATLIAVLIPKKKNFQCLRAETQLCKRESESRGKWWWRSCYMMYNRKVWSLSGVFHQLKQINYLKMKFLFLATFNF